ncbi:hypothetical protein, partial [Staphylococcus aureus]
MYKRQASITNTIFNRGCIKAPVSYTHLRAHETTLHPVCRLLLEKILYTSPSPRDKRRSRMP